MHHFVASNPGLNEPAVARALLCSPALQHENTTLHFNQQRVNPVLIALNCFSKMLSVGFGSRDENNSKSHQRSRSTPSVCGVRGSEPAWGGLRPCTGLCHPALLTRELGRPEEQKEKKKGIKQTQKILVRAPENIVLTVSSSTHLY